MSRYVRLALLGDPVSHSRSPVIHRTALIETGLEGEYRAIEADEARLRQTVEQLREGILDGLNITMPLKSAAAAMADDTTELARDAGSVNTLRARNGRVEAHSTDAVAFQEIFGEGGQFPLDAPLLVLGHGGSARALLAAVDRRDVYISGRSQEKAEQLAGRFDTARALAWAVPVSGAVVVNATPIGMRGEVLPLVLLEEASGLVDLPYGESQTPAVSSAGAGGLPVVDGIEFLARQAAASFEWWTGKAVDSTVLAKAARNV